MKKYFCLLTLLFICSAMPVRAAEGQPITAALNIEYQFTSGGDSTVITNIELTNHTSGVYAPEFTLQVKGMVTPDVSAYDSVDTIPFELIPGDQSTDIKIKFAHPVGGKGRAQNATIKYSGPKATLRDKIWEVTIPSLNPQAFITSSQVSITTPPDFGIPVETHPSPQKAETLQSGQKRIYFQSSSGEMGKVTVRYGNFQTYRFDLQYKLTNTTNKTAISTLQLPADSFDHQLNYSSLTPPPINVVADSDGSWDALYEVHAGKTLTVLASGISSSQLSPEQFFEHYTPDVTIAPAQYAFDSSAPPTITWRRPFQYWPLVSNEFMVEIANPNGVALYNVPVLASVSGFQLLSEQKRVIDILPPFGKTNLPLRFKSTLIPPEEPRLVAIGVGTTSISYNITDKYVIVWYASFISLITGLIIGLGFVTVKARHLHLQKHPRRHSVHRQSEKSS